MITQHKNFKMCIIYARNELMLLFCVVITNPGLLMREKKRMPALHEIVLAILSATFIRVFSKKITCIIITERTLFS